MVLLDIGIEAMMSAVQEQVQALRCTNVALTAELAAARAATSAHAERALGAQAQQAQREAAMQAHLEDAKRGAATAQQHAEKARKERDFFMAQSTEAATLAASATAERDAANQVCYSLPTVMSVMLIVHISTDCSLLLQSQGTCQIHHACHILCALDHALAFLGYLSTFWQTCGP